MSALALNLSGFEIGAPKPWWGRVFLLLALLWFGGVFYVLRPDLPHAELKPAPYIILEDGKHHRVYLPQAVLGADANWVEGLDVKTEYTPWDFMKRPTIRFLILAVAPILAALVCGFVWLGIAEWRVRRRYGYISDLY